MTFHLRQRLLSKKNTAAIVILAGLALAPFTQAHATQWQVNPDTSHLSLEATQAGTPFTGEFRDFTATITLDPANLASASITAQIKTGSISTDSSERDGTLPGADWFDVESFPTATFVSHSVKARGPEQYEAQGDLTIKGTTVPLTLPFSLKIEGDNASASGTVSINRQAFGIGTGQWDTESVAGFSVSITYQINATK
ncbi:MAG: YceI family protein [Parvibaculaceae bacterium]|nr:YceI family protein [Parvibaculaceae bacterium]